MPAFLILVLAVFGAFIAGLGSVSIWCNWPSARNRTIASAARPAGPAPRPARGRPRGLGAGAGGGTP